MTYIAFCVFGLMAAVGLLGLLCMHYRVDNMTFVMRFRVKRTKEPELPKPIARPKPAPAPRPIGYKRPDGPLH